MKHIWEFELPGFHSKWKIHSEGKTTPGFRSKNLPLISFVLASLNNPKNPSVWYDKFFIISFSFQSQKSVLEVVKPQSQNNSPYGLFGWMGGKIRRQKIGNGLKTGRIVFSVMCLLERMKNSFVWLRKKKWVDRKYYLYKFTSMPLVNNKKFSQKKNQTRY